MPTSPDKRPDNAGQQVDDPGNTGAVATEIGSDKPADKPDRLRQARPYLIIGLIAGVGLMTAAATYPYWRSTASHLIAGLGLNPSILRPGPGNGRPDDETISTATGLQTPRHTAKDPAYDPVAELAKTRQTLAALMARTDAAENRIMAIEQRFTGLSEKTGAVEAEILELRSAAGETAPIDRIDDALRDLLARVAALEIHDKPTPPTPAPAPAPAPDLSGMIGTIVSLAERVSTLETTESVSPDVFVKLRDETDALKPQIAELDRQVAALTDTVTTPRPERDRAALVLLGVSQLAVATAGPGPYRNQFDALHSVTLEEKAWVEPMQRLASHADTGAPSLSLLKSRFGVAASAVIRSRDVGAADDQLSMAITQVASLFTIRKIENTGTGTVDAALVTAERALASGDLETVVSTLETLDGPEADAIAPWLGEARARLAVGNALSELQALALAALATAG